MGIDMGKMVALFAITLLWTAQALAVEQAHINGFLGNIPTCTALSSGRVANTLSDNFRQQPAASIFCDEVDLLHNQKNPIVQFLKMHSPVDRIDGMYFAISDSDFANALCSIVSDNLHFTRLVWGGGKEGARWADRLTECIRRKMSKAKLVVQGTGQIPGISSFHPKFLLLSSDDLPHADLIISSGNPTRRSPNNLDDYLSLSIPKQDRLFLWHQCISEEFLIPGAMQNIGSLAEAYKHCSLAHLSFNDEETQPYLLPFDREQFLSQFAFWAGKSTQIDIISQGYNSLDLSNIVKASAQSGTKVRVIRDDDLLLSNNSALEGEMLNAIEEYYTWDHHICAPNVSTRFLLTNRDVNYLHAKFVLFSGEFGKRVLFGSANLTHAALYSNIENVYVSRNPELTSDFQVYFETLWNKYALTVSQIIPNFAKIGVLIATKRKDYYECNN
ncbi:TPA: phospholipase D-like domain-containing protein [Raoultella ornithinolytica]|uniref:phospholipase D-like domain-containing protein n=1 Tax=Raoultella TaxID=160674 RepID=UPI0022507762|nr:MULTISPECIES: phospholipase D-like domain-containing protein [Raoultella]EKR9385320.1 hypothetical protein [Raoultella ornithinolytica]MEB7958609.1 phospholipase D-like domain-containing protein [Raoultella ornithinolytica]MEB7993646.1 phospholipase D-like domain-containing protein [Raoultella ornithinolytica]HCH7883094.1 hypothetical protein [Raoultella ornithinolytica]